VYIGIVLVGFFYVWKKGVLDWGPSAVKSHLRFEVRSDILSNVGADVRRGER